MKPYDPSMNPAIERLCAKIFPGESGRRELAMLPRQRGFATAGLLIEMETDDENAAAMTEGIECSGLIERAAALTEGADSWDVSHYREFPIAGTSATAMIEEIRGGRCRLTVVSEDPSLHEARVEFDLGGGLRDVLTLVECNGICTGHHNLDAAWSELDASRAQFRLIAPTQPG